MPGELEQGGVEIGVRVRCPEEVAEHEQLALSCEIPMQACGAGIVDALRGEPDGQPFEDRAGLEDLDGLFVGDLPYARALCAAPGRRAPPARGG